MWYKIKKGLHRAFPLSFGIHKGKTSESYEVIFDESCRYIPDTEGDWNKLVGWSYGILPKVDITWAGFSTDLNIDWDVKFIPAHHRNSIRVGWRYLSETDKIELCIYSYEKGIRIISDSTIEIDLNKPYRITQLGLYGSTAAFSIHEITTKSTMRTQIQTSVYIKDTWGYNLGLFFGGNLPAQHDTKVFIKKL